MTRLKAAITAALINAISGGSANSGIQSNGNASITMGKSTTDGEISFTEISLDTVGVLAFRASPYNSATSMQLDIYFNDELDTTITVVVKQDTRDEVRYRIPIPQSTTSIRLVSVGGSTSKRACMQELYLLSPKAPEPINPHAISQVEDPTGVTRKEIREGRMVIVRGASIFSTLGQKIR